MINKETFVKKVKKQSSFVEDKAKTSNNFSSAYKILFFLFYGIKMIGDKKFSLLFFLGPY